MSHRRVTRSQSATNVSLLLPPLVVVQAVSSIKAPILVQVGRVLMAIQPPRNFVTWDSGSPLIAPMPPTQWGSIPTSSLKSLPEFTGDGSKTIKEHLQDVADVCTIHNVMEQM